MFDKLENLNIETCSDEELIVWFRQAIPVVDTFIQASRKLAGINFNTNESDSHTTLPEENNSSQYVFIANGRKFSMQQLSDINEDDFDVIMDTTTNSLRYRKDPAKHTKLQESKLEKIGSHRMQMLARMLKRPSTPFHAGNIGSDFVAGFGEAASNAFSKSIAVIRKALGQNDTSGPYIEKKFDADGITGLKRGCVYKINTKWRYLLICHRKSSEQSPL